MLMRMHKRIFVLAGGAVLAGSCSPGNSACLALGREDILLPNLNRLSIQQVSRMPIKYMYVAKCKVRQDGTLASCAHDKPSGGSVTEEELRSVDHALEGARIIPTKVRAQSTCATVQMLIQNG